MTCLHYNLLFIVIEFQRRLSFIVFCQIHIDIPFLFPLSCVYVVQCTAAKSHNTLLMTELQFFLQLGV